jgi:arabinan endo-1,5-alpha-L-arabinosidase
MREIKLIIVVLAVFIYACGNDNGSGDEPEPPDTTVKYKNPVFKPVFADPTILDNRSRDGYFYAYATQDNWGTTPAEERIAPIIRSKDLVEWEDMGDAFEQQPQWNTGQNLVWAPNIKYRDGKYYLYYSLAVWGGTNSAIGVAVSDTPYGTFTDLGKIFDSNESGVPVSIDPYLFTDTDGQHYLFWGSFNGIYGVPMERDGITAKLDEKFRIAGNAFEATYIFMKDGYYYFFGSVGSCCDGENSSYHVTVARSNSLEGPYLDINNNDIMNAMDWNYGNNDIRNVNALYRGRTAIAPGHNSEIVIDDDGQEWILYHAILKPDYTMPNGASRRPLFIDKVMWDSDGWPKIGLNGFPSEYEVEAPVFN